MNSMNASHFAGMTCESVYKFLHINQARTKHNLFAVIPGLTRNRILTRTAIKYAVPVFTGMTGSVVAIIHTCL